MRLRKKTAVCSFLNEHKEGNAYGKRKQAIYGKLCVHDFYGDYGVFGEFYDHFIHAQVLPGNRREQFVGGDHDKPAYVCGAGLQAALGKVGGQHRAENRFLFGSAAQYAGYRRVLFLKDGGRAAGGAGGVRNRLFCHHHGQRHDCDGSDPKGTVVGGAGLLRGSQHNGSGHCAAHCPGAVPGKLQFGVAVSDGDLALLPAVCKADLLR